MTWCAFSLLIAGCVPVDDADLPSRPDADFGAPADAAPADLSAQPTGTPGVGAHAEADYAVGDPNGNAPLVTPSITTRAAGSTILLGVGRGNAANFSSVPGDNQGNAPYQLQDMVRLYAHPNEASGTAVYAYPNAKGGPGFRVSVSDGMATNGNLDEITLFVVEVAGATQIVEVAWNEITAAGPTTSASVTTTGPATLVAFWWGENDSLQSIAPDSGFSLIEKQLLAQDNVQGAAAFKSVTAPGTYQLTWTATPAQGAQMWLIAVQ